MGWKKDDSLLKKKVEEIKQIEEKAKFEFSYEDAEEEDIGKLVFSIYGLKGAGKTSVAYGIPEEGEKVVVFSYDHKSKMPLAFPFLKDKIKAKVLNAVKPLDKSSKELYLLTSEVTYEYNLFLLKKVEEIEEPDWIVFDGTEVLSNILEMVMRKRNNLLPYQGIGNPNIWKERKQYIDDIHSKAMAIAKRGVIYTMYTEKDEIIKDGEVIRRKDVPKWIGSIMLETDVVIKTESEFEQGKKKYYAVIESSKIPTFPEGIYDVTGRRLIDVLRKEAV